MKVLFHSGQGAALGCGIATLNRTEPCLILLITPAFVHVISYGIFQYGCCEKGLLDNGN